MLVGGEIGGVRLLDFGVARGGDRDLTHTGQMLGTPGYMAPEQALGRRGIDGRADLFGLGCTLYEAVTGQAPFPGDEVMAVLASLLLHEPTPVEVLRPETPARLVNLIASLLAKEVDARLADAATVVAEARALAAARAIDDRQALAARPTLVLAHASAVATVAHRPGRRRRWQLGAAVVGAGGVAAIAALAAAGGSRGRAADAMTTSAPGALGALGALCTIDIRSGCPQRCAAGDGDACYLHGESLATGLGGLGHDPDAAIPLLVRACDLNSGRGCTKAGTRILDAVDQGRNPPGGTLLEAERVLQRGCELRSPSTCRRLGMEHLTPKGHLRPDDDAAFDALNLACELGDHASCWLLVGLRDQGSGSDEARARATRAIAAACARGARNPACGTSTP